MASWWQPGRTGGLVSRPWAQVFVFPLPSLRRADLDSSLRFKVQALLPGWEPRLQTRFFRHQGRLYGLALVDRLPDPHPEPNALFLGMPPVLPGTWPPRCLLAVASPEGWEIHSYVDGVLSVSYPPVQAGSPLVLKILGEASGVEVLTVVPDPAVTWEPIQGSRPAPPWPRRFAWPSPWSGVREVQWPWAVGSVLAATGVLLMVLAGYLSWESRVDRNEQWGQWVRTAKTMTGTPTTAKNLATLATAAGERVPEVLAALGRVWPTGVVIRKLTLADSTLSVTARAPSALGAVSRLGQEPLVAQLRVVQIRPVAGGEEFDLQGKVSP